MTLSRAWGLAIDMLIVSTSRLVTHNSKLTAGNLPQLVRFGVAAGLLSLATSLAGTAWLVKLIAYGFSGDVAATLTSPSFNLLVLNNTPSVVGWATLAIATVLLTIAHHRRQISRSTLCYLAIPCAWIVITTFARTYAAGLIGHPVLLHLRPLISAKKDPEFERGRDLAEAVLEVPHVGEATSQQLRLMLLAAYVERDKPLDALRTLEKLVTQDIKPDRWQDIARLAAKMMWSLGKSLDTPACVSIYDKYIALIPNEVRPSPFRFALPPERKWDWMQQRYDEGRTFASQNDNTLLRGLALQYKSHPDTPFMLFLLGEAAPLETQHPKQPAGLLAAFTVASESYKRGVFDTATCNRFQRILESDSTQTFVDDAALYYGKILVAAARPKDAVRVLERGIGRGNGDRSKEILALIHSAGAMLDRSELEEMIASASGEESVQPLRAGLRGSFGALAAWRAVVQDEWDAQLLKRLVYYEDTLTASAPIRSHEVAITHKQLEAARVAINSIGGLLLPSGARRNLGLSQWASLTLASFTDLRKSLVDLGFDPHRLAEDQSKVDNMLAHRSWHRFLEARGWIDAAGNAHVTVPDIKTMTSKEAYVLESAIVELERGLGRDISLTIQSEVTKLRRVLEENLPPASRDVIISRRLDELMEALAAGGLEGHRELDELLGRLQDPALRRRHYANISDNYIRLALSNASHPSLQAFYVDQALDAHEKSYEGDFKLESQLRMAVVTQVQAGILPRESVSIRGVIAKTLIDELSKTEGSGARVRSGPERSNATSVPAPGPGDGGTPAVPAPRGGG